MPDKLRIPMVDLGAQYDSIKTEIDEAMSRVICSGQYIGGREVDIFESRIARYNRTSHAVSVASGTDALRLSLTACQVGRGDEVITTPFTFIATAEAISQCGATPVFCDIDPATYNIDPMGIEAKITTRTKAIVPVHLYGQPADMESILEVARKYGLWVIEDCAQSIGAQYRDKKTGSIGDIGCLSFFPSKTLGAYGDGGAVITSNSDLATAIRVLGNHGGGSKYNCTKHGFNSRLDTIQAAMLSVKVKYLEGWIFSRRVMAAVYSRLLEGVDGIWVPVVIPRTFPSFNYYTIRVSNLIRRDGLATFLGSNGVGNAVYYPVSLHLQEVYRDLGYKAGDFPHSERAQEEVLSLPMYPELGEHRVRQIVSLIKEYCDGA